MIVGTLFSEGGSDIKSYLAADVPDATSNKGQFTYILDDEGGAVPAFSDGVNWRRVTDRGIIVGAYPTSQFMLDFELGNYRREIDVVDIDSVLEVTRAGIATAENLDGTRVVFAANQPRRTDQGLLIEDSATNYLEYSEDFSNAYWGKVNTVVSYGVAVAPDGSMTASKLEFSNPASSYIQALNVGLINTTAITSIDLKGSGIVEFQCYSNDGVNDTMEIDLTDDWKRYDLKTIFGAGASDRRMWVGVQGSKAGAAIECYVCAAQLEQDSLSSYIKTEGGQVTRPADIIDTDNLGGLIAAGGTVYVEAESYDATNPQAVLGLSADNGDAIGMGPDFGGSGDNSYAVWNRVAGGNGALFNKAGVIFDNAKYRAALRLKTDDFGLVVNGEAIVKDISVDVPVITGMAIGRDPVYTQTMSGWVKKIVGFDLAKTDQELVDLTS